MSDSARDGRTETLVAVCRTIDDKRLYLGRARLTATELVVNGWSDVRRVAIRLPLSTIGVLERGVDGRAPALDVTTVDGRRYLLGLSAPGLWRWAIRSRLPDGHPLATIPDRTPVDGPDADGAAFDHRVLYEASRSTSDMERQPWRPLDEIVGHAPAREIRSTAAQSSG